MNILPLLASLLLALFITACGPQQTTAVAPLQYSSAPVGVGLPIYRFAVHPLYNPKKLSVAYQPLVDHLNTRLQGVRIELEASRDYASFEQKYRMRAPAFLLPNPWQTLQAQKTGYHVIAMAGDAQDFKGIFLVRRDSGIKTPADLKGRVVSYPSRTALAAAIMPQYFLHMQGINILRDIENNYVGSQESAIMHVYLGKSAAGATWPPPWRLFQKEHPAEAAQLMLIWETPYLLNNSVMVRDDVPANVRESVTQALFQLTQTPQGEAILQGMETARFTPASDASYTPVADYIQRFEKAVRPVESP